MNKEKREEIIGDQCPRIFKDLGEASVCANNLSEHINYLMKENEKLFLALKGINVASSWCAFSDNEMYRNLEQDSLDILAHIWGISSTMHYNFHGITPEWYESIKEKYIKGKTKAVNFLNEK